MDKGLFSRRSSVCVFACRFATLVMALQMAPARATAFDDAVDAEITGSLIHSSGTAEAAASAFDGDRSTYFRASSSAMQYVGLDLGAPYVITRVSFVPAPHASGPDRMQLSLFEGANSPDFMDAVPLYLIADKPASGEETSADITVSRGFRYVRYVGGSGSYCDVAELKFYGHAGEGDDSRFYQITNLPTLSIHVADGAVPTTRGEDFDSRITFVYDGGTIIQEYPVLTRVRGNFSATPENKPYRLKFDDGKSHHMMKGSAVNESPVKAKKWVLLNHWRDKSLMRNPVAWQTSRRVGPEFTPWSQPVDLVLNGDYRGTYVLADHVSVHSGRIDITEMTEDDTEGEALTGGYFVEVDNNADREPLHFTSGHGNPISVHDPDDDVIQPVQFDYIRNTFNSMESIVFGSDYADEEAGYRSVFDLESFLKYFLISEFNGNTDMLCQVFMYKERGDDRFYTGPVWDHDLALDDDATVYPGNDREDWTYTVRQTGRWGDFVSRILSDPSALAALRQMWARLRDEGVFNVDAVVRGVDSLRAEMRASAALNFIRWPYLNQYINLTPAIRGSWEAEVDVVRDYVRDRIAWMDRKLGYDTLTEDGGVYRIGTSRDLCTFSQLVASGATAAQAVLVADIDMEGYSDRFSPIGTATRPYCGRFDGGGHTIRNLHVSAPNYAALFGLVGAGASFRNIQIDSTCTFTGNNYVAALIAQVRSGIIGISGCGSAATVTASGSNAAGLVAMGRMLATLTLTDCYNVGPVTAADKACALVGPSAGRLTLANCYNAAPVIGAEDGNTFASTSLALECSNCYDAYSDQVCRVTPGQVCSGELCFVLNGTGGYSRWRQNIDNGLHPDPYPVPSVSGSMVYRTPSGYTNSFAAQSAYRYYKLSVTDIRGGTGSIVQFSEFDILDGSRSEVGGLEIYAGTDSSIPHEDWSNLTDNSTATKYCSVFNGLADFLFDAQTSTPISAYRIYSANDSREHVGRNPTSWTLSGSNTYTANPSAACWEVIDIRTGDTSIGGANYTGYDFEVTGGTSVRVDTVILDHTECRMEVGDALQLSARILPETMSTAGLLWTSTDMSVARVDMDGKVVAVGQGTAQIRVTVPYFGTSMAVCEVEVTGLDYILGDVNGDGYIDGADLVAMTNIMLGKDNSSHIFRAADMNGDGVVDSTDIMLLLCSILGVE